MPRSPSAPPGIAFSTRQLPDEGRPARNSIRSRTAFFLRCPATRSQHAGIELGRTLGVLADAARNHGDEGQAANTDAERAAIVERIGPEVRGLSWDRDLPTARSQPGRRVRSAPGQSTIPLSARTRALGGAPGRGTDGPGDCRPAGDYRGHGRRARGPHPKQAGLPLPDRDRALGRPTRTVGQNGFLTLIRPVPLDGATRLLGVCMLSSRDISQVAVVRLSASIVRSTTCARVARSGTQ